MLGNSKNLTQAHHNSTGFYSCPVLLMRKLKLGMVDLSVATQVMKGHGEIQSRCTKSKLATLPTAEGSVLMVLWESEEPCQAQMQAFGLLCPPSASTSPVQSQPQWADSGHLFYVSTHLPSVLLPRSPFWSSWFPMRLSAFQTSCGGSSNLFLLWRKPHCTSPCSPQCLGHTFC